MKKLFFFLIAAITLVACGPEKPVSGTVDSIALLPTSLELTQGGEQRIDVQVTPSNATDYKLNWTSDNEAIAVVSENGTVGAVAPGSATITATVDGTDIKATCAVTVTSLIDGIKFYQPVLWRLGEKYSAEWTTAKGDVRTDSFYVAEFQILSDKLFINENSIAGEDGFTFYITTAFMYDTEYWYTLGTYSISESCKEYTNDHGTFTFEHPFMTQVQAGHFEKGLYEKFYQDVLEGKKPNSEDYPFLQPEDSYFNFFDFYIDENGEPQIGGSRAGYPLADGEFEFAAGEEKGSYAMPYYNFSAKMFGNPYSYGLATENKVDPETGEEYLGFKNPVEMAPITDKDFQFGTPTPREAPRRGIKRSVAEKHFAISKLSQMPMRIKLNDIMYKGK